MNQYLVEFLGSFFIIFIILYFDNWATTGIALAISLFIARNISGGSFNPLTVMVKYFDGRITILSLFLIFLSEISGSLVAFFLYKNIKLLNIKK